MSTTASGLLSASSRIDVASATNPTSGQVLTATGATAATWQTPTTPVTSVGVTAPITTTGGTTPTIGISATTTNDGGTVIKQASFPGTQQTGNINVSGTINAGTTYDKAGVEWLGEGTSFPGSPTTNQRYFRTDRGIEYYYDGTRWLTTQTRTIAFAPFSQFANNMAASTGAVVRTSSLDIDYGVYIINFFATIFVFTTHSATNHWTLDVNRTNTANANSLICNVDTFATGRVANTLYLSTFAVNTAYLTTDIIRLYIDATKINAPGNLELNGFGVTYKGVG